MKRYRILVFSTSLITLTLLIMINVPIAAFPYIETYPYGIASVADDQQAANDFVLQEWEEWKSARITSSGASGYKRVQRAAASDYDSVSEGLAYGLLFSVYFDEQPLFDDLYGYVRHYLNDNGLMAWHIDAQGNVVGEGGWDCATDADEDIALALIFADKVWGSDGS
ncbi:MAG: glycosyl hydrolase family 8, partial [Halanaerobiales bacterium]